MHCWDRDCSFSRHQKLVEEAPPPACRSGSHRHRRAPAPCQGRGMVSRRPANSSSTPTIISTSSRSMPGSGRAPGHGDGHRDRLVNSRFNRLGEPLSFSRADIQTVSHAFECRINSEDPTTTSARLPADHALRVPRPGIAGFASGRLLDPPHDSLVGKLIVHAADRPAAMAKMLRMTSWESRVHTTTSSTAACSNPHLRERSRPYHLGRREFLPKAVAGSA